jgi:hypothetical protein
MGNRMPTRGNSSNLALVSACFLTSLILVRDCSSIPWIIKHKKAKQVINADKTLFLIQCIVIIIYNRLQNLNNRGLKTKSVISFLTVLK